MPTVRTRSPWRRLWLLFPAVLLFLPIWSCARPSFPLDDATATALEDAADRWCPPDLKEFRSIPRTEWPPAVQRLGPNAVFVYPQAGVYIEYGSFYVQTWGIWVVPKGEQRQGGFYQHLRGRLYRYDNPG
jgi:hypothetical protein